MQKLTNAKIATITFNFIIINIISYVDIEQRENIFREIPNYSTFSVITLIKVRRVKKIKERTHTCTNFNARHDLELVNKTPRKHTETTVNKQ
ncbi:hypothetical protein PUN28_000965 [Cardiocondyla obscurior]|uniref:Secreted protein n=1 Tax=Cardiocondyla obscurior TaxID=286306 RepID=A0AAW2H2B5_9HYME